MKIIRLLFRLIFLAIILLIIAGAALIFLGIQDTPVAKADSQLTPEDVDKADRLFKENDPQKLKDGEIKHVVVREDELNLALDYATSLYLPYGNRVSTEVDLRDAVAESKVSLHLPNNPVGKYFNITSDIGWEVDEPVIKRAKVGDTSIPGWVLSLVIELGHGLAVDNRFYQPVRDAIGLLQEVDLRENQVAMVYQWDKDTARDLRAQGQSLLWSPEDKARIIAYNNKLYDVLHSLKRNNNPVSLAQVLGPMFETAAQRSDGGEDAIAENRALFLMLATYIEGRTIDKIIGPPESGEYLAPANIRIVLRERKDLTQHFLVSAGFAAAANAEVSDAIGVFKEMRDSRGGTGFSFTDIVGDRAGVTMAEMGTRSGSDALKLQARMQPPVVEGAFMPSVYQLPDEFQEAEFARLFQNREGERYKRLIAEIEHRIAACPVYQ